MRLPEYLVLALMLALGSCQPKAPTPAPINLEIFAADCRAIYAQELGREPEAEGLVGCERRIAEAKLAGSAIPQEVFRVWVRQQPEWIARQQALADAARVVVLPRLRARGSFIEQENGQWFTLIDATHFSLYAKYKEGQDIDPLLQQVSDLGFNSVRIFGVTQNPWPEYQANLTLARYGESYYTDLPAFFQKLAKYRLYGNFVAFISNNEVPGETAQLAHWNRLVETLRPISNVLLSAVNENNVHPMVALPKLPQPMGIFSSHGSNGGTPDGQNGAAPPLPHWDWIELHTNDTFERARKVGHNCWELNPAKPCVASENTRFPDRATRTIEAFDSAAGAALLAAGATFHSWLGRSSTFFDAPTVEFAKAWVAGAKSIPLSCQAGDYRHGASEIAEEASGGYLRVYQRGNDPACRVRIRR